ncbi:MAG: hypothetical protein QXS63_01100 [Zestosphaera sp.]
MAIEIRKEKSKLIDVKFSEWAEIEDFTEPRVIILLAFFIPGKYSSFTLSFTDGIYRIRKSFSQQNEAVVKELRKWYQELLKGKGKALFEVRKEDDKIILDYIGKDNDGSFEYRKDVNGSLILKRISGEKEDIPF